MQDPFDPARHRDAWSALAFAERRRIIKSVNRGRALDSAKDARLAVGVARNQMRFWRWAWLIGPAGALLQLGDGWLQFAVNAVVATAILGGVSWWMYRRAARAHTVNLEVATTGRAGTRKRSRAPDEPRPARSSEPDAGPRTPPGPTEKFTDFRPDPSTSRRKVKRRKRRR